MTSTVSEARIVKTSQACERCRSLKVRCLPSTNDICQKCRRSGASCIWAEQKPLPIKRKPKFKSRVSALEAKVDELAKVLEEAAYPSPASTASRKESSTVGYVFGTSEDSSSIEQVFSQCQLTYQDVIDYLDQYQQMSLYFPFAVVPAKATIETLIQERPMFLLAAITAASSRNRKLQIALESKLRTTTLEKVMFNGEKSLDLLSSLLVYLAWYHFYYVPKFETSSQLTSIAVSMCYDLGLHLSPEEAMFRKAGLHLQHYRKVNAPGEEHDMFFSPEARRLYLGCYYLSSSSSWIRGKPSNIPYAQYMADCAASLGQEKEYPTDEAILPLVQLQRMSDECHETVCAARETRHTAVSLARLQATLQSVETRLERSKNAMSNVLRQSTFVELSFHIASVHIHEMDMINPFANSKCRENHDPVDADGAFFTTSARLDVLSRCLEAAKEYFESFLTIPECEYRLVSATQWYSLTYATVVLYKLSLGIQSFPEWDIGTARAKAPFEGYLEICCQRMEKAVFSDEQDLSIERKDLFSLMGPIWRNVQETYLRLKELPQQESTIDTSTVHAINFSGPLPYPKPSPAMTDLHRSTSSTTNPKRCPAFPIWKGQREPVIPHEWLQPPSSDILTDILVPREA